jgi:hypothetical protein
MADGNSGNGALYFIVGALCIAVAVGGFLLFGGNLGQSTAQAPAQTKSVDVKVEVPKPDVRVIEVPKPERK